MKEFLAILLYVLPMSAATLYLDKAASGANNGTSWADAWTSTASLGSLTNNDTLYVRQGVYSEALNIGSAASTTNLSVLIDPAATGPAVFTWGQFYNCSSSLMNGLVGTNRYFRFTTTSPIGHGFLSRGGTTNTTYRGIFVDRSSVTGSDVAQQHCFYSENGQALRLESCTFTNTSGDCVSLNMVSTLSLGWTNAVLTNCYIYKPGDDGVELTSGGVTLDHCIVDFQGKAPLFGGHPDGVQPGRSNSFVLIKDSYIHGPNQGVFFEFMNTNIWCINTIFDDTGGTNVNRGINSSSMYPGGGDPNWLIANCTFYNFRVYSAINGGFPALTRFVNNVAVNCRRFSVDGSVTNFINAHTNAWYDEPGVTFGTTERNQGLSYHLNPAFVSTNDWHLTALSAIVGIGENLSSDFTIDRDGVARGSSWDLGALQYVASAPAPAPTGAIIISGSITISGRLLIQ